MEPLRLMTMRIAWELGKDLTEVSEWALSDLVEWEAFFRIKNEAERRAIARASKGGVSYKGGVTVVD